MSFAATAVVWKASVKPAPKKLVLLALADCLNDDTGQLNPSMRKIAAMASCSKSQAQRHVHALVADGLVTVVANSAGGRPGATPRYALDMQRIEALIPTVSTDATGSVTATGRSGATGSAGAGDGSHGRSGRVASVRQTGSTHATRTIKNQKEPEENPPATPSTTPRVKDKAYFLQGMGR
jgi:hypothetical protein